MTKRLLIIFAKNPILGQVKTRLAATMGDEKALEIYLKLLEFTRKITADLPFDKVVFYSHQVDQEDLWSKRIFQKQLQDSGDLGARMQGAFEWGFQSGYQNICIIGSDCLELTPEIIENAFEQLNNNDAVIGPTQDGGYYLLGIKQLHMPLFKNKDWGAETVANDTLIDLKHMNLSCYSLETLTDVDREEDLKAHDLS